MPLINSFRWRLTWIIVFILLALTGLLFLLDYQINKRILTDYLLQHSIVRAKALDYSISQLVANSESNSISDLSEREKENIRSYIQHFSEEEPKIETNKNDPKLNDLFIFNENNEVSIDFPSVIEKRLLPPEERINQATLNLLKQNKLDTRFIKRGKNEILLLTFPIFHGKRFLGLGRVEMSMDSIMDFLNQIKYWGLITAGGIFLIGAFFAAYVAKNISRPISNMVQAAVQVGKGNLTLRLDENRKDEMGTLMRAFNQMLNGIQNLEVTQQRVKKLEVASQLGAKVAHEVKNPLNSIGLILDHLRDHFVPSDALKRKKFMELTGNMKGEIGQLNRIVEEFLRTSKPLSLSPTPTEMNELLENTLMLMENEIHNRHVKILRHFDLNLPKILVDYQQVRHAIFNLIINSLQAMPQGGTLQLSTFLHKEDTEFIAVSIRDSGGGIPQEMMNKIFDPYFTTKERGFGLGLSIVERIIQGHRGKIEVQSREGIGTEFTLLLPIKDIGKNGRNT